MKFVLTAFSSFLICSLLFVQSDTVEAGKGKSKSVPHPPNWNNTHHYRPSNVRPLVSGQRVVVNNYHTVYGNRFRFGYYYSGYNHNHWSYNYWDTRYGAYLYFDPYVNQYFYWCAPHFRYYPITYVPLGTFVFPYVAVPVAPSVPPPAPPPPDDGPPSGN